MGFLPPPLGREGSIELCLQFVRIMHWAPPKKGQFREWAIIGSFVRILFFSQYVFYVILKLPSKIDQFWIEASGPASLFLFLNLKVIYQFLWYFFAVSTYIVPDLLCIVFQARESVLHAPLRCHKKEQELDKSYLLWLSLFYSMQLAIKYSIENADVLMK